MSRRDRVRTIVNESRLAVSFLPGAAAPDVPVEVGGGARTGTDGGLGIVRC